MTTYYYRSFENKNTNNNLAFTAATGVIYYTDDEKIFYSYMRNLLGEWKLVEDDFKDKFKYDSESDKWYRLEGAQKAYQEIKQSKKDRKQFDFSKWHKSENAKKFIILTLK